MIAWIVGLTSAGSSILALLDQSATTALPAFETQFSWRDLILFAGGLFLGLEGDEGNTPQRRRGAIVMTC